jgi:hypothetical protein
MSLPQTIPGFSYDLLVSFGDIGILKNCIGQLLAWISGLKVALLPLGPSCPLQAILLSDLVGCGSSLQKVMVDGRTFFFNLKRVRKTL